ncbi:hypothetical protein OHA38_43790 (plasmid) [Streptomyces sp. NBC_01732]|uniref:hypothetical protein n=1 Tax=Streptomyces sp. NBC_01732 TaxID=2975926 RepID=UPI00352DC7F7|nr:hypothetical protein OHA38_43790 [Streptomyces sp. NBC_01732]
MGLFSRKHPRPIHATEEQNRSASAYMAELMAEREKEEAQAQVDKWDRITKAMTVRGEDHEGRDMAIRNRERARRDVRDAENRGLKAKFRR